MRLEDIKKEMGLTLSERLFAAMKADKSIPDYREATEPVLSLQQTETAMAVLYFAKKNGLSIGHHETDITGRYLEAASAVSQLITQYLGMDFETGSFQVNRHMHAIYDMKPDPTSSAATVGLKEARTYTGMTYSQASTDTKKTL